MLELRTGGETRRARRMRREESHFALHRVQRGPALLHLLEEQQQRLPLRVQRPVVLAVDRPEGVVRAPLPVRHLFCVRRHRELRAAQLVADNRDLSSEVNIELNFPPNFEGLVLGCIDADFCK